jgi:hypothetical protein
LIRSENFVLFPVVLLSLSLLEIHVWNLLQSFIIGFQYSEYKPWTNTGLKSVERAYKVLAKKNLGEYLEVVKFFFGGERKHFWGIIAFF